MGLDWRRIEDATTEEAGLWRLVDELNKSEASEGDLRRVRHILRFGDLPEDVRICIRDALRRDPRRSTQRLSPLWAGSSVDIDTTALEVPTQEMAALAPGVGRAERVHEEPYEETQIDIPTQILGNDSPGESWSEIEPPPAISPVEESSLIAKPTPELMRLVPVGPHRLRFGDSVYGGVDELAVLELLRRGILLGSEIDAGGGRWIRVIDHPAFDGLIRTMGSEMNRVITRRTTIDVVNEITRPAISLQALNEATLRRDRDSVEPDEITSPSLWAPVPDSLEEDSAGLVPDPVEEPNSLHSQDQSEELSPSVKRALEALQEIERGRVEVSDTEVLNEDELIFNFESMEIDVDQLEFEEKFDQDDEDDVPTQVLESKAEADVDARPRAEPPEPRLAAPIATSVDRGSAAPRMCRGRNTASLPAIPPRPDDTGEVFVEKVSRERIDPELLNARDPRLESTVRLDADENLQNREPVPRVYEEHYASRRTWPMVVLAIAILAALAAATAMVVLIAQGRILEGVFFGQAPQTPAEAVAHASDLIGTAAAFEHETPGSQVELAATLERTGAHLAAADVLREVVAKRPSAHHFEALAAAELAAKRYSAAREAAFHGWKMGADEVRMQGIFAEALRKDRSLRRGGAKLDTGSAHRAEAIANESGRYALYSNDRRVFELIVDRRGDGDFWQRRVAATRLCEVLSCEFSLPKARAVTVSKSTLAHWLGGEVEADLEFENGMAKAALVEIPLHDPMRFPIELDEVWRPWLAADSDLESSFAEDLLKWDDHDVDLRPNFMRRASSLSKQELVRDLASVMLFDFLTNHYARFSAEPPYGTHLGFANGNLVASRHGALFLTRQSNRVEDRGEYISRFNEREVFALSAITRAALDDVLFPGPDPVERRRLETFWKQRDAALVRVDQLVSEHGSDAVMIRAD